MASKSVAFHHNHSATDAIVSFFAKIGHFFVVAFDVFSEAQAQARKAHAKYPFVD